MELQSMLNFGPIRDTKFYFIDSHVWNSGSEDWWVNREPGWIFNPVDSSKVVFKMFSYECDMNMYKYICKQKIIKESF